MTRVVITGASGFIGRALATSLRADGVDVRAPQRDAWVAALEGADAIVHLAGPAHARFDEIALRAAITDATAKLAAQAEAAGVRRFVFVSSIKASAAQSFDHPLSERDPPAPEDPYGRAKLLAERALMARAALSPVVLRPPLVHAADANANFAALMRLAATGAPMPFAGVKNKRSVIARASLIDAIKRAQGEGPSGVFHVCDQPALSTGEIIAALRRGLGKAANLFDIGVFAGLAPAALTQSLEIDDGAFRDAFGFVGTDASESLAQTARAWAASR